MLAIAAAALPGTFDPIGYATGVRAGQLLAARVLVSLLAAAIAFGLAILAGRHRAALVVVAAGAAAGLVSVAAGGHAAAFTSPIPMRRGRGAPRGGRALGVRRPGRSRSSPRGRSGAARRSRRRPRSCQSVSRFSAVALVAVALVGLTGRVPRLGVGPFARGARLRTTRSRSRSRSACSRLRSCSGAFAYLDGGRDRTRTVDVPDACHRGERPRADRDRPRREPDDRVAAWPDAAGRPCRRGRFPRPIGRVARAPAGPPRTERLRRRARVADPPGAPSSSCCSSASMRAAARPGCGCTPRGRVGPQVRGRRRPARRRQRMGRGGRSSRSPSGYATRADADPISVRDGRRRRVGGPADAADRPGRPRRAAADRRRDRGRRVRARRRAAATHRGRRQPDRAGRGRRSTGEPGRDADPGGDAAQGPGRPRTSARSRPVPRRRT